MTVGMSSVSTLKSDRVDAAIANSENYRKVLTDAGAQNVRLMIMMDSTPIRLVTSWEAENQEAMGRVSDAFMANPAALELMRSDQDIDGYVTETWIEI